LVALAILLASCSVNENDNAMDSNMASDQATDQPIMGENGQPASTGNQQSPAPAPPPNGQPAPGPSGDVMLSASPSRTAAGSTMTLTLTNSANYTVGYNLCTSAIETAAGSSVPTDRVCTMELRTLQPGRSANYSFELPANLGDGSYRFSTGAENLDAGPRAAVKSNMCTVQ
jgi:hypothetical protein